MGQDEHTRWRAGESQLAEKGGGGPSHLEAPPASEHTGWGGKGVKSKRPAMGSGRMCKGGLRPASCALSNVIVLLLFLQDLLCPWRLWLYSLGLLGMCECGAGPCSGGGLPLTSALSPSPQPCSLFPNNRLFAWERQTPPAGRASNELISPLIFIVAVVLFSFKKKKKKNGMPG